MNTKQRMVHLHHCKGMTWKLIYKLLQIDPSLSSIYTLSSLQLCELLSIPIQKAELLVKDLHSIPIQSILNQYNKKNIQILSIFEQEYPSLLKNIYNPPLLLYVKGNANLFKQRTILSVVGTRTPSNYGFNVMNTVLTPLIKDGWLIVSGLASGIDTKAHILALNNGGSTIAVIAGGIDNIYPKSNTKLADVIMRDHLLVSEHPPGTQPERWHFPLRNRIISGLSLGTLVVEAKEKSGSLITAEIALQEGRDVFAIPGSILTELSQGTNKLIQQGAKLVLNSNDILVEYPYLLS
ncbi:DNA-processing protein DprA [Bacillus timonensis]|nr:DNA-processing protein DprA [Bacillus timonensis]